MGPKLAHRANPPRARLATPIVALTRAPGTTATANAKMSCARSKANRPWAKRLTSQAPKSPSRVLPAATPSDVATDPAVVTLTRKAPTATAGHTRGPKRRNAASAIPVGGHTAVALA
jgi:hypothetical protein